MSLWMPSWALAQFATFFAERDLNAMPGTEVLYSEQIPSSTRGAGTRQVDVCVHHKTAGIEYIHIVEVEDRGSKFGGEALDELEGKARDVGAHAATAVATRGFTKAVLARIRAHRPPPTLRAIHLRAPRPGEVLPDVLKTFSGIGRTDDTRRLALGRTKLIPYVYADAINADVLLLLAVAHIEEDDDEFLLAMSALPPFAGPTTLALRALTKPGSSRRVTRFTIVGPEGSTTLRLDAQGNAQFELRPPMDGSGDPTLG